MRDRLHDEAMAEFFKADETFAVEYLSQQLRAGEQGDFLVGLRQYIQAHGGVKAVAVKAGLNPKRLYRMLSMEGNPTLRVLLAVLQAVGLKLNVEMVRR